VTAALVLAVYAVVEAPDVGWGDAQTIALFAGSAALLAVFAAIESRVASPLLPLRILRSRTLVGANLGMFLFSAVAFAAPFVLTLYVQQVLGYSPVEFGLTSIVFPLAAAAAAISGQGLVLKLGFRPLAVTGMVLLGIGSLYWGQVSPGGSYFRDVFLGLLISGAGTGLTFVTCSIAALAGVGEREAGVASGLSNTTFQLGGAVGTAIVSTVVVSRTDEVAGGQIPGLAALTEGFQAGFLACIVFAGLGLVAVIALLGRRAGKEPVGDEVRAEPDEAFAEAPAGGGP
jgi:Na+/melibiose symporter-like transporter